MKARTALDTGRRGGSEPRGLSRGGGERDRERGGGEGLRGGLEDMLMEVLEWGGEEGERRVYMIGRKVK